VSSIPAVPFSPKEPRTLCYRLRIFSDESSEPFQTHCGRVYTLFRSY